MKNLKVSEIFYSIQGEGIMMGTPCVFIRLQSCNLLCEWCDTIDIWKKGKEYPPEELIKKIERYEPFLKQGAHMVFTGGEPLLQQIGIKDFVMTYIQKHGYKPYIEIETNGTKIPFKPIETLTNLFICSPKLENSGEPKQRRLKRDIIKHFNKPHLGTIFKFVLSKTVDFIEVRNDFLEPFKIEKEKVWLMPAASNEEEIKKINTEIAGVCLMEGVNYSSRLQIQLWNETTGV
jgi:organic radical activating enzyme